MKTSTVKNLMNVDCLLAAKMALMPDAILRLPGELSKIEPASQICLNSALEWMISEIQQYTVPPPLLKECTKIGCALRSRSMIISSSFSAAWQRLLDRKKTSRFGAV